MQNTYLDLNDPSARYLIDLLPADYGELVEHLYAIGDMEIVEEGGCRYITWQSLCHHLPPHP